MKNKFFIKKNKKVILKLFLTFIFACTLQTHIQAKVATKAAGTVTHKERIAKLDTLIAQVKGLGTIAESSIQLQTENAKTISAQEKEIVEMKKKVAAATKIQAQVRGMIARKEYEKLKADHAKEVAQLKAEKTAAITKDIATYEKLSPKELQEVYEHRRDEANEIKELMRKREQAATKLQAAYRGKKDREKVSKLKAEKKREVKPKPVAKKAIAKPVVPVTKKAEPKTPTPQVKITKESLTKKLKQNFADGIRYVSSPPQFRNKLLSLESFEKNVRDKYKDHQKTLGIFKSGLQKRKTDLEKYRTQMNGLMLELNKKEHVRFEGIVRNQSLISTDVKIKGYVGDIDTALTKIDTLIAKKERLAKETSGKLAQAKTTITAPQKPLTKKKTIAATNKLVIEKARYGKLSSDYKFVMKQSVDVTKILSEAIVGNKTLSVKKRRLQFFENLDAELKAKQKSYKGPKHLRIIYNAPDGKTYMKTIEKGAAFTVPNKLDLPYAKPLRRLPSQ